MLFVILRRFGNCMRYNSIEWQDGYEWIWKTRS
jgi:hypothetical protein